MKFYGLLLIGIVNAVVAAWCVVQFIPEPSKPVAVDREQLDEAYRDGYRAGVHYGAEHVQRQAALNRAARYEGPRGEWFVWNTTGERRVRLGGPEDAWRQSSDQRATSVRMEFERLQVDLSRPKVGASGAGSNEH